MKLHAAWGQVCITFDVKEIPSGSLLYLMQQVFDGAGVDWTPEQIEKITNWLQERGTKNEYPSKDGA